MNTSYRRRFIFEQLQIRGVFVHLEEVWQTIRQQKQYPDAIAHVLGQALVSSVLLSSNLKIAGKLITQTQSDTGCLQLLAAESTSDLTCRATARWQEPLPEENTFASLVGDLARFVLTMQPEQGEAWQGIVAVNEQGIAPMLTDYMNHSEQLPTFIALACDKQKATGLMLQCLPSITTEQIQHNADEWQTVSMLAQTVTEKELLTLQESQLLRRLFHEYDLMLFDREDFAFACTCSEEKVGDMLKLIGAEEVAKVLIEQGSMEVCCDYCQKRYVFDEEDVQAIFGMDVVEAISRADEDRQTFH